MEQKLEKIKKFSKVIHILLTVAFVVVIVVGALQLLALSWRTFDLPTETITVKDVEADVPVVFRMGDTTISLPFVTEMRFGLFGTRTPFLETRLEQLLATVALIIGIGFVRSVFKKLREDGSPFREDVVRALKKTSLAFLVVGMIEFTVLIAAGIVWALCLVFDYGCGLQDESDTTL